MVGYSDDDFTSSEYLLYRLEEKKPKGVILGDCSIDDLEYYKNHIGKYKQPVKINKVNGENLIGRQSFLNYFRRDFPTNFNFYKEYADFMIYEVDKFDRRKSANQNLTLSYYTCYTEELKLILGGPNKLLVLEDLAVNLELEELQYIIFQCINEYKTSGSKYEFFPSLSVPDFRITFKSLVQITQKDKLFDKRCQYTAAVYRKIHNIYDKNMLFMPNLLISKTYDHMYIIYLIIL